MSIETQQPLTIMRHKFSVADYHRMAEAGILGSDARVELLNGEIIEMSPAGARHAGVINCRTM